MLLREIIGPITETAASGIVEPVAPSNSRNDGDAYQTRPPRQKRRSRWQTPPAPAPKPTPSAT